jgi:hypothetical protein
MTEQPEVDSDVMSRLANHFDPEPAPEVAQPEAEAEQPAEIAADQTEDDTPEVEEEAGEESGLEELDLDGESYRFPAKVAAKVKEWKEGALRQEDYTRKTQQLAELHRHVALTSEAVQKNFELQNAINNERLELSRVEAELSRYKSVDWSSLDMESYVRLRGQFDMLRDRAGELSGALNNKVQQFEQWKQGHKQQLTKTGQAALLSMLPKRDEQTLQEIAGAALSAHFTPEELGNILDPRFFALAYKAAQFEKLQSAKNTAVSKAQKAPPVLKPGVSQGQTAASDKRYRDTRNSLKKTGSVEDAARLFLMRSK